MKKIAKLSLPILMLFGLVGCGGGAKDDAKDDVKGETIVLAGPATQHAFLKEQAEKFLKDKGYNGYSISMFDLGEGDVNDATKVPDWTASTAPDVYAYASDQTYKLIQQKHIAKVPSTIKTSLESTLTDAAIEAGSFNNNLYGYSYAGDNTYFMYYDKTVFTDATKLEKFDDVVATAKTAGRKVAYNLGTSFFTVGAVHTFGAKYTITYDADGKYQSASSNFGTSDEGLRAGMAIHAIKNNDGVTSIQSSDKAPTSANGYAASIDGGWNYNAFKTALGENLGMAVLPKVSVKLAKDTEATEKNLTAFMGYKLYGVNPSKQGTEEKNKIKSELAAYLVSDTVQESRFDALSITPTSKAVLAKDNVKSSPLTKVVAEQAKYSVPQVVVPDVWDDDLGKKLGEAKAVPNDDPEKNVTLEDAVKKVLEAFDKRIKETKM